MGPAPEHSMPDVYFHSFLANVLNYILYSFLFRAERMPENIDCLLLKAKLENLNSKLLSYSAVLRVNYLTFSLQKSVK